MSGAKEYLEACLEEATLERIVEDTRHMAELPWLHNGTSLFHAVEKNGNIFFAKQLFLERIVDLWGSRRESRESLRDTLRAHVREAKVLELAQHIPGVVDSIGYSLRNHGLIMEALTYNPSRWLTLTEVLHSSAYSLSDALDMIDDLIDTVGALHQRGMLHLDLKPGNIAARYNTGDDRYEVKLFDFNAARFTERVRDYGQFSLLMEHPFSISTPGWGAPEQMGVTGEVDERADQFAVAQLAYSLLSQQNSSLHELAYGSLSEGYYAIAERDMVGYRDRLVVDAFLRFLRPKPVKWMMPREARVFVPILRKATQINPKLRYNTHDFFLRMQETSYRVRERL